MKVRYCTIAAFHVPIDSAKPNRRRCRVSVIDGKAAIVSEMHWHQNGACGRLICVIIDTNPAAIEIERLPLSMRVMSDVTC